MRRFLLFCLLSFVSLATDLVVASEMATSVRLIADLNSGSVGSFSSNMVPFAGALPFSAYTLEMGRELWKYKDGVITLATNINETADDIGFGVMEGNDSVPDWLTEFRGNLYFSAFDPRRGGELWRYDGANAFRVADINPDFNDTIKILQNNSWPNQLTVAGNYLYFSAENGGIGRPNYELWKCDGITVSLAANLHPDIGTNYSSYPKELTAFNGLLIFTADDGLDGFELWKHNGTSATMVTNINPGTGNGSFPKGFRAFNGHLYFQAYQESTGFELWRTDGQIASRTLDLAPGSASSFPEHLTVFNNALYFGANDGINGQELWRFDGATSSLVSNINLFGDSFPKNLTVFQNRLCFAATDGINGWELWVYDGTTASMVTNLNTVGDSFPEWFRIVDKCLFFVATTPETGYEVWRFDGQSVSLVTDINPGPGDSYPQFPAVFGNRLVFSATSDGFSNWEPWVIQTASLHITRLLAEGNGRRLRWTTLGGSTNIVEASQTVEGTFTDLSEPIVIPGSGETMGEYFDANPGSPDRKFYRIRQP